MKKHSIAAAALFLPFLFMTAGMAVERHIEGVVTHYSAGSPELVVCTFDSPYSCNLIRTYGGTSTVASNSGKPAHLSLGAFVDVDAQSQGGVPVATHITVHTDQFVRSIKGFQADRGSAIAKVLNGLGGVRSARICKELGEALITFNPSVATPASIERAALRKSVTLSLPGQ